MNGTTAFHVSFLSLDFSQNDSCLIVFIAEGKRVFHVSILYLVRLGNGYAYDRLSYGQTSTYIPLHTYYVTVLVFVCTSWTTHNWELDYYAKNKANLS